VLIRVLMCSALLGCLAWSQRASAEEEDAGDTDPAQIERARQLFREGIQFSDRGDHEQAVARFEEALSLYPAASIRYNLAATYVELGRRAAAATQLDAVLADPEAAEELAGRARELLITVEQQIGNIEVDRSALDARAVVFLDAQQIALDHQTGVLRVDPGSHEVSAELDGEEVARESVEVTAGQTAQISLAPLRPVEQAIVEAATEPVEEPARTPLSRNWRLWVGVSAGVVAVALGVGLGVGLSTREPEYADPVNGTMDPGIIYWR
jgi:tetratricopeptide (TPR) repeat protein